MRFLVAFRAVHNHFRISEFRAVLCSVRDCEDDELGDLRFIAAYDDLCSKESPAGDPLHVREALRGAAGVVLYGEIYAYVELRDEAEAAAVARHCILVRAIFLPLGHGRNIEECAASVDIESLPETCAPLFKGKPKNESNEENNSINFPSYRVVVEAFGRSLTMEQQLERVHAFVFIYGRFPGPVKLKRPSEELWVFEDSFPPGGHTVDIRHPPPRQLILGRLITRGNVGIVAPYTLKKRTYIGPTSMDAELSFIMANMGRVGTGHLVLDPFAGTGSVLVGCAARGAHTVAADINLDALRGKQKRRGIWDNFHQYKLDTPLGVVRCDALHSAFQPKHALFDAVITDPPYGIKEGAKMFREDCFNAYREDAPHVPSTQRVRIDDLLWGLFEMAVSQLVVGGRLVFWLPTTPDYDDADLPTHPLLKPVYNCEQPLTLRMSRRLIVMLRKPGAINDAAVQNDMEKCEQSNRKTAHFSLASRMLHQPQRDEGRLATVRRSTNVTLS